MNLPVPGPADALHEQLMRVDIFKHAIANSFAIDLRHATGPSRSEDGQTRSGRFHYLAEIDTLLESRVARLTAPERRAYGDVSQNAQEAFWKIYLDFLPLVHSIAATSGVEPESLERVLARAILLFDVTRKTKFVTYLEKTLRESVKNLRGKRYAEELGLPLSAGRLVPQLMWEVHQASMHAGHSLSVEESDRVVIEFLRRHPCRFSEARMANIAQTLRADKRWLSIDQCLESLEPSTRRDGTRAGNDCFVDDQDERRHQLGQIELAMERARFDVQERTLLYARLELPHDEALHERIASGVTSATLRKRKSRLLVRLMAARYANQAPRFGRYLNASAKDAHRSLRTAVEGLADECGYDTHSVVEDLLNWMALSESVYRISILERGRLRSYLNGPSQSELASPLFQKLKAALIEQDRLDFPCLRLSKA
ncbi:MAG: hypothetical protein AAFU85_22365 [Planctomycetota bacterium]